MGSMNLKTIFSAVNRLSGPVKTMTGDVSKFNAAAGRLGKFAKAAAKGALVVAGAAVAAGTAVFKAADSFSQKADEIAKTSRMLGLSATALQELRHAAGMQGVETEALGNALKLLNNQMGQAKTRTGSLYSMLSKLNPELGEQLIQAENTDDAFMLMMKAIKAETDTAKRAAIAQAAFGRTGQELIKFADAGAEGIAALRQEAHKYGLVIDDDAAAASEEFQDSLTRLKGSALSLANKGLGAIVTKLQPVIQRIAEWVAANKELIGQKLDKIFAAVEKSAGAVWRVFEKLKPALEPLGKLMENLIPMAADLAAGLMEALGPVAEFIGKIITGWDRIISRAKTTLSRGDHEGVRQIKRNKDGQMYYTDTGELVGAKDATESTPIAPATAPSSATVSRSELAVTFANPPAGMNAKQTGMAPGITVNMGATAGSW